MSTIKISDLSPVGSELFNDSESFMSDLVDNEIGAIHGGSGWRCTVAISLISVVSVVSVLGTPASTAAASAAASAVVVTPN